MSKTGQATKKRPENLTVENQRCSYDRCGNAVKTKSNMRFAGGLAACRKPIAKLQDQRANEIGEKERLQYHHLPELTKNIRACKKAP